MYYIKTLEDRLTVGRRILVPPIWVRILVLQPIVMRGRAEVARLAHNQKVESSSLSPALYSPVAQR